MSSKKFDTTNGFKAQLRADRNIIKWQIFFSRNSRCPSSDVPGCPLADGSDDEEVVKEEEAAVLPRPRPIGHGHEVVLDQVAGRGAEVVGTQSVNGELQLTQDL